MRKKYFNDDFGGKNNSMGFKHRIRLQKDLERLTVEQVAKKYGVYSSHVRHYIKKFGLTIKLRGRRKRINIKIRTIGLNKTHEKRPFTVDPIYKKKTVRRRLFDGPVD